MPMTQTLLDDIKLLTHFNLDSVQEGIKIHSAAEPAVISAAQRLFDKGLITQHDGGYLTTLGITAAEHAQALLLILK